MNNLEVFKNEELRLRARMIENPDGSISINAEDAAIGFGWTQEKNGKTYVRWETLNGYCKELGFSQQVGKDDYIPESLFYRLGMKANNHVADKFQNWLAMEVIPSIRKNGGYIAGQETLSDDELMAKALLVAQNKIVERDGIIKRQQEQIAADKPKTIFADAVSASKTSILVGDLAKLICQNGHQIGQKRLFEWLRQNNYLIKSGNSKNMPMQRYVEQGLFEVKESSVQNPDGSIRVTRTTKVTGKGQIYFINKFIGKEKVEEENSRICVGNSDAYGYSLSSNANKTGVGNTSATLRKEENA